MGWPLSQDYNEAIQNPATSFATADLKRGEVVVGPMGLPMPRSGNFADVYQMIGSDGRKWAIKCFTRHVPGLQDRYAKIDTHLQRTPLPFNVGFEFLDQGIRVRGEWYPILKMEWVEGITLNEFVRNFADKPPYLRALLGLWLKLSARLREARIAHADLQHGNVLLVPGASANKLNLKLIDYDGMWVPALAKTPSGEAGHPAYQHPRRLRERIYSADVDRFPHLVIACALRATALGGKQLWQAFDNGDNLLFRETDLANPGQSKLFRTLWSMDDPTLTNLLALLVLAAQRPLADTPWIDEVLVGEQSAAVSDALLAHAADLIGVPRREVRQALPTAQVYVTPEQGHPMATAYEEMATAPLPRYMRRRRSVLPMTLVGGGALLLLAGIGVGVALSKKNNPPPETPLTKKDDRDPTVPNPERPAKLDANWHKIEPSEPVRVAQTLPALPEPMGPPNKGNNPILRLVPNRAASLGIAYHAGTEQVVCVDYHALSTESLTDGQPPKRFGVGEGPFMLAAISPDAATVATVAFANHERVLRCWDVVKRQATWPIVYPYDNPTALAITPDGKRVALSGVGIGYIEYDIATNKELRRHPALQAEEMHFSPDGGKLLTKIGEQLEYWELDRPERLAQLNADVRVQACGLSGNGKEIWAVGTNNEIKRWSTQTYQPLPSYIPGRMANIRGLHPLGRTNGVLIREGRGLGLSLDVNQPTAPVLASHPLFPSNTAFAFRDGHIALIGGERGYAVVRVGEAPNTVPKKSPPDPRRAALTIPLEPNSNLIEIEGRGRFAVVASPNKVKVTDLTNGECVATYDTPDAIHAVGVTADDRLLVCRGPAEKVQTILWNWQTKQETALRPSVAEMLANLEGVPHPTKAKHVLARSATRGVLLFDTDTQQPVPRWPNAAAPIMLAVPHPDGTAILYATAQSPVKFWSPETQETFRTLEGSAGVLRLQFLPEGKKLLGLFPLGRLLVWDVETGKVDADVPHELRGPFNDVQVVSAQLAMLRTAERTELVHLETGKTLDRSKAPEPFQKQQWLLPDKQKLLRLQTNTLEMWPYDSKGLAELEEAPKPTPPPGVNPNVLLVRDGPVAPLVGIGYSQDGGKLFVATQSGYVQRYHADTFALEREGTATDSDLRFMQLVGPRLFTASSKGDVRRWDPDKLDSNRSHQLGMEPLLLAAKPDSDFVFVLTKDNKLHKVDLSRNKDRETLIATPRHPMDMVLMTAGLANAVFAGDASTAAVRWPNSSIGLWNMEANRVSKLLINDGAKDTVAPTCMATTATGRYIVIGTTTGYVRMWDTNELKKPKSDLAHRVEGKTDCITDVIMTEKGEHFLTRGIDGKIIYWELATFKKLKEYIGPPGPGRLAVAPDGATFTVITPGRMELWKLP